MNNHIEEGAIEVCITSDGDAIITKVYDSGGESHFLEDLLCVSYWATRVLDETINETHPHPTDPGVYKLSGAFKTSWSDDGPSCMLLDHEWEKL